EAMAQAEAVATGAAHRKQLSSAERGQLQAAGARHNTFQAIVERNSKAAIDANDALADRFEDLVVVNTVGSQAFFDFLRASLLQPVKVEVAPFAVVAASQKPLEIAWQLFDLELAADITLTEREIRRSRDRLAIILGILGGSLLLSTLLLLPITVGLS